MYELTNSRSSILNPTWAISNGSQIDRVVLFNSYVPPEEIAGAVWLMQYRNSTIQLYSDYRARNNALNAYAMISRNEGSLLFPETEKIESSSLVYLRALNIFDQVFEGGRNEAGTVELYNATALTNELAKNANLIYSNGGNIIYYAPFPLSFNSTK